MLRRWGLILLLFAVPVGAVEGLPGAGLPDREGSVPRSLQQGHPVAVAGLAATQSDGTAFWTDADGAPLPFQSHDRIIDFLQTAEIESFADIPLGVTGPRQVVMQRDGVRMRAVLRDYEETYERVRIDGVFYARLRDSFVFEVAAYELSRLLGLNNVPPVTLRRIGADRMSLQIWVDGAMMERDRLEDGVDPPSFRRFREQQQNMRVFDSLIGNVDRNQGNILIDEQWRFWLIDHSRSFPRNDDTLYLDRVTMCGRKLFDRIRRLDRATLAERLDPPLASSQIDWLLRRRDKVVARIELLIAERGAEAVLFDEPEDGR